MSSTNGSIKEAVGPLRQLKYLFSYIKVPQEYVSLKNLAGTLLCRIMNGPKRLTPLSSSAQSYARNHNDRQQDCRALDFFTNNQKYRSGSLSNG